MLLAINVFNLGGCFINALAWLDEHAEIRSFMEDIGLGKEEVITGTVALGYPKTEDGQPLRSPLSITGNLVTYVE